MHIQHTVHVLVLVHRQHYTSKLYSRNFFKFVVEIPELSRGAAYAEAAKLQW